MSNLRLNVNDFNSCIIFSNKTFLNGKGTYFLSSLKKHCRNENKVFSLFLFLLTSRNTVTSKTTIE